MRFSSIVALLIIGLWATAIQPVCAANTAVEITGLVTNKVRYLRQEAGVLRLTLHNTTATEQVVMVEGELVQELSRATPLTARPATVPAGQNATIEVPFSAPAGDYGCAVRIRVKQENTVLAQGQEMFAICDTVWPVAIGSSLTIMDMSGRPWQNPAQDMAIARARYYNWWEKMFWPPDDWGDMTPSAESWYSGQGGRYEVKKVLKECVRLAKANGIASITYGKSTGGGPAGWEIARRHPEWFKQDAAGRVVGTYDTGLFAQWDTLPKFNGRAWHYLYPNLSRLDALDHGIDEILHSAQEYGWDGVRFDGDFTWVGNDEVGARNQRRMKERIWAQLPHFVFGFNEGYGPPNTDPDTWSHAVRESLAGGGHWMNEGVGNNDFGYATNGKYTSFHDYWTRESAGADQLRKIGASYHFIYYLPKEYRGWYKFVLGTSAGAHPVYGESHGVPGCANWGRFLTRWSACVWDINLRNRPDTELSVNAPLWTAVKERVIDVHTAATVAHLILPPTTDDVTATDVKMSAPARNVVVRVRIPAHEQVLRAAAIAPEHPDDALSLPVMREGEWASVTVPEVTSWTMVVFEHAGKYTVPAYPKFTEPVNAAQVKAGAEADNGKLARDPLRPDLPQPGTKTAPRVRVLEMENLYQTQAKVEHDPDASGGACVRADSTMTNSTLISHAFFPDVTPGHYRATYRMKLKSKTDAAGKPIWAGFGLYVALGTKQLWLKEIGPNDFTTPGNYETFTVDFDFLGEGSTISVCAFWRGQKAGGTIYIDNVSLEQLATFNDAQLAEKLKYVAPTKVKPGGGPGLDVLVLNGLYSDRYRLPAALAQFGAVQDITPKPNTKSDTPDAPAAAAAPVPDLRVANATVLVEENTATLSGYSKNIAELCRYDVVVLANADASWLGFSGRAALREFVNAGGGLLVLGGSYSLGQGYFIDTFLADILPVNVLSVRDAQPASPPLTLKPASTGLARVLPATVWTPAPSLYWRHRVTLKPGATVQLLAGTEPVLITGTYGKGRVAVFTGTVLGQPAGKDLPFWEWTGWPTLMHQTIGWLGTTTYLTFAH